VPESPRFTHNAFPTARLDACAQFYCDVAGMRLVKRRGEPGERVFWLAPADTDLPIFVLVEKSGAAPPSRDEPIMRHLGFEVSDRAALDALDARVVAAGADATDPQYVDEIAGHVFMLRDPDGRVVEFSAGQDVSPANWDDDSHVQ